MANKTKNTSEVHITAEFADGDTRLIKEANPQVNLTMQDLQPIATAAAGVLIGDKTGAEFSKIKEAFKVNKAVTTLDLNIV